MSPEILIRKLNRKGNRHLTPASDWLNVVRPLGACHCVPEIAPARRTQGQYHSADSRRIDMRRIFPFAVAFGLLVLLTGSQFGIAAAQPPGLAKAIAALEKHN